MYQHSFNQKGFKGQHNVHKNLNGNCFANFGTNNGKSKGQIKPKSRLASTRFSQKMKG